MVTPRSGGVVVLVVIAGFLAGVLGIFPVGSRAQVATTITPDATLPTPSSVSQSGMTFDIDGGTPAGSNLFHSFSQFDVGTGATANFNVSSGTENILSRVTGNVVSQIDGTLTATDLGTGGLSGANLFLLNPAGVLFGDNAQLNLGGSFHATTADYIKFPDGSTFAANPPPDEILSTEPPSAFGFLTENPEGISVGSADFNVLFVANDQTLSLVGGPITVGAADGSAPGFLLALDSNQAQVAGRINLVSVASAGEVPFDGINFNTDSIAQLGAITIQGGSIVDAREVFIRSGQLDVKDAFVFPGGIPRIFGVFDQPDGGEVNIKVTDNVTISGSGSVFGFTPGIRTWAGVGDAIAPPTDAPDITIDAGSVSVSGAATIRSERFGPGTAADILITSGSLEVRNGATVNLFNSYAGPGGTITVNAEEVELSGDGDPGFTGISAQSDFHPGYFRFSGDPVLTMADGGSVTINAPGSLTINQAGISVDSRSFGRSGDITVDAGDISLSDGGVIAAQSGFAGDSGNVTLNAAGNIDMDSGSRISASTGGSGDGGIVEMNAGQSISLAGTTTAIFNVTAPLSDADLDGFAAIYLGEGATFADLAGALGLDPATATIFEVIGVLNQLGYTAVADLTVGDGGKIAINTPQLAMDGESRIASSTLWDGNAGTVEISVDHLALNNGAAIRSRSGGIRLDNNQPSVGTGNAGSVMITASDTVSVSGPDSIISTNTFGDGDAGNVSLSAGEVNIQNGGSVTSESGGTLDGEFFVGTGNAGTVNITATGPNTITIAGTDSRVSTTTNGAGAGGDINLDSAGNVEITSGGSVTSESTSTGDDAGDAGGITISAGNKINLDDGTVSTRTENSEGGNVEMTAPKWVYLLDSEITTSVKKGITAGGGDITIDPEFVILNHSNILANAFGGPGGNINIVADNVLISANSRVDASSQLGIDGTVNISNPDQEVAQELAVLPENYLDISGLISDRCGATAGASSLVPAGPGGLTVDPDGYLPSFGAPEGPGSSGQGTDDTANSSRWWGPAVDPSALHLTQATCIR